MPLRLLSVCYLNGGLFMEAARPRLIQRLLLGPLGSWLSRRLSYPRFARSFAAIFGAHSPPRDRDRKSVVSGKSVSVRVDLGGRRISKKKNQITPINIYINTIHTT